jgi:hypothetical protein
MPVETALFFPFMTVDFCLAFFLDTGHALTSFGKVNRTFTYLKMDCARGCVKNMPLAGIFERTPVRVV